MKSPGLLAILSTVGFALSISGCKDPPAPAASTAQPTPSTFHATTSTPATPLSTPTADVDAPAPADGRPLILCYGDSLTAGYGTEPGESYPDDLQRLLDAHGYHYRVLNLGVSGNTTKDGLDRIGRVLAHHPAIVVLEFGGNDGLRGLPLDQTKANLASIIDQLQHNGATVALAGITLPPDYGKDYIAKLNAMYPALAKQYHLRLLPFLLQDVYGTPGDMQEDATHATAQGNQQVALNVEKLVMPLLKK